MREIDEIAAVARDARQRLQPGLSDLDAVPLEQLLQPLVFGNLTVCVRTHVALTKTVWGVTTFHDDDRAVIWLNREAWPELPARVPRTRFTVAHELGHCLLHPDEYAGLTTAAEPDHHADVEREANAFAAHLLVPDQALKRLSSADVIAKRFGVSLRMASLRLTEGTR